MATIEQQTVKRPAAPPRRAGVRRIRVTIRRVNPWSVLKFSLFFYFCLMVVIVIGLSILYLFADALGVVDSVERFIEPFWSADVPVGGRPGTDPGFEISGGFLLRTVFLIGLVSVILWSAVTLFVAFLYNLISDLIGGIEVSLQERR